MKALLLGYLVPLGFVFAGLWDGRDILVIFWIEFLIISFYAMLRMAMMLDMPFWEDLISTCIWCVLLLFIWAGFGSYLLGTLFREVPPAGGGMWDEVRTLLIHSFGRNGWVAALVLIVVHGIDEVKRYRRTDGYRTIPKDIGMNTVKYFLTMYFFTFVGGFLTTPAGTGRSMSIVVAVSFVAVRLAIEYWLGQSVPASDSPPPADSDAKLPPDQPIP
jgi:hypothetical protein